MKVDAEKYTEPNGSKEQIEGQLRIALDGYSDSKLWGEHGLIAATMRCVYGYECLEQELQELQEQIKDNHDKMLKMEHSLSEVREQRDTLVDALRTTWSDIDHLGYWLPEPCRKKSDNALIFEK